MGATVAAFAALLGVSTQVSRADTFNWNNTGTDFNNPANWTPNTGYPGFVTNLDVAQFTGAEVTNPNLSAADSIGTINFSDASTSGYTLSSANNGTTLTLNSVGTGSSGAINAANTSGTNTISAPLVLGAAAASTQVFTQAAGGTLSFTGSVTNTNALTLSLTGGGTFSMTNANIGLSANISIDTASTLLVGNDNTLGSGSFNPLGNFTIASASASTRNISNALGSFGNGGAASTLIFGTSTSGNLNFTAGGTAGVTLGTGVRTFTINNAITTFSNTFSGSGGSLLKNGAGTMVIAGVTATNNNYGRGSATAYGAGTTISAGTLQIGTGGVAVGAISTAAPITNNAALIFNHSDTIAQTGTMSGSGTFTHTGTGQITFTTPTFATNTAFTNGSTTATIGAVTGVAVGSYVVGTGIQAGTVVTAIGATSGSITTITLSLAPTANGTSLSFGNALTGGISVNSGTVIGVGGVANPSTFALGTGPVTIGSAGILGSTVVDQTLLNRITSAPLGSVLAFSTGFSGVVNLDLSGSANLANVSLGATSNATLQSTSTLIPNNNTYRLGGGAGILTVQAALLKNTTAGTPNNLVVSGGVVSFGTSNPTYTGTTTINAGGTLQGTQNSRLPSGTLLTVNGTDDLITTSDTGTTQTVAGLSGSGTITNGSTATAAAPAKVFVVNSASGTNNVFSGVIQDRTAASTNAAATLSLTKNGLGTLSLTGASTYSVATTINGGTLFANNATGSATGTSAVAVNGTSGTAFGVLGGGSGAATGGTLGALSGGATSQTYAQGILGVVTGTVTVNNFGHLAPGNSVGTLTVGALTLGSGSVLDYEFNGTANDLTSVTGALTLNTGSGLVGINLLQEGSTTAFASAGTYNLIRYGAGSTIDTTSLTVANALAGYNYSFTNDTTDSLLQLSITTTPVPEPATWVSALVGIGMIGFVQCRRMRARA